MQRRSLDQIQLKEDVPSYIHRSVKTQCGTESNSFVSTQTSSSTTDIVYNSEYYMDANSTSITFDPDKQHRDNYFILQQSVAPMSLSTWDIDLNALKLKSISTVCRLDELELTPSYALKLTEMVATANKDGLLPYLVRRSKADCFSTIYPVGPKDLLDTPYHLEYEDTNGDFSFSVSDGGFYPVPPEEPEISNSVNGGSNGDGGDDSSSGGSGGSGSGGGSGGNDSSSSPGDSSSSTPTPGEEPPWRDTFLPDGQSAYTAYYQDASRNKISLAYTASQDHHMIPMVGTEPFVYTDLKTSVMREMDCVSGFVVPIDKPLINCESFSGSKPAVVSGSYCVMYPMPGAESVGANGGDISIYTDNASYSYESGDRGYMEKYVTRSHGTREITTSTYTTTPNIEGIIWYTDDSVPTTMSQRTVIDNGCVRDIIQKDTSGYDYGMPGMDDNISSDSQTNSLQFYYSSQASTQAYKTNMIGDTPIGGMYFNNFHICYQCVRAGVAYKGWSDDYQAMHYWENWDYSDVFVVLMDLYATYDPTATSVHSVIPHDTALLYVYYYGSNKGENGGRGNPATEIIRASNFSVNIQTYYNGSGAHSLMPLQTDDSGNTIKIPYSEGISPMSVDAVKSGWQNRSLESLCYSGTCDQIWNLYLTYRNTYKAASASKPTCPVVSGKDTWSKLYWLDKETIGDEMVIGVGGSNVRLWNIPTYEETPMS